MELPLPVGCGGDWVDDTGGAEVGKGSLDSGNKWKEQEATALGSVGRPHVWLLEAACGFGGCWVAKGVIAAHREDNSDVK